MGRKHGGRTLIDPPRCGDECRHLSDQAGVTVSVMTEPVNFTMVRDCCPPNYHRCPSKDFRRAEGWSWSKLRKVDAIKCCMFVSLPRGRDTRTAAAARGIRRREGLGTMADPAEPAAALVAMGLLKRPFAAAELGVRGRAGQWAGAASAGAGARPGRRGRHTAPHGGGRCHRPARHPP